MVGLRGKNDVNTNHQVIQIEGSAILFQGRVFLIAEAGVNHNGDIEMAKQLIDVAHQAGADAVKFQTFSAEALATANSPKAEYQLATTDATETQVEMLRKLELSEDAHRTLKRYCDDKGIIFLSTPFDEASADFLETLDVPAFKLSSGDLTNTPLIAHVARKKRPLILSTGMATLDEVAEAVSVAHAAGCDELVLLHCVSNYPAQAAEANLRAMKTMRDGFAVPVGFSDHTEGSAVCLAAVALGATVIEKHFTLDRNLPGPDHVASLEPHELIDLIRNIRRVESSLGNGKKVPTPSERETAKAARRSIVAAKSIAKGELIERQSLTLKRPGTGMSPSELAGVVGQRAVVDIAEGTMIELEMFE